MILLKEMQKKHYQMKTVFVYQQDLAFQLFGNESALGKEIVFQGKKLIVRGVYKLDKKSSYNPSCVVNFMDARIKKSIEQWGNFQFVLFLKVKKS